MQKIIDIFKKYGWSVSENDKSPFSHIGPMLRVEYERVEQRVGECKFEDFVSVIDILVLPDHGFLDTITIEEFKGFYLLPPIEDGSIENSKLFRSNSARRYISVLEEKEVLNEKLYVRGGRKGLSFTRCPYFCRLEDFVVELVQIKLEGLSVENTNIRQSFMALKKTSARSQMSERLAELFYPDNKNPYKINL